MAQILVLSCGLIVAIIIINTFFSHISGIESEGQFGSVVEGILAIIILYVCIIELFGSDLSLTGIPFMGKLEEYKSIIEMYKRDMGGFAVECAKLISLTFVISLLSNIVSSSWGGNGYTGKIIRSIILVLGGLIANSYLLTIIQKTVLFDWSITALQCFFSGTALVLTPAMVLGKILGLDPKSSVVSFLVKKLPQTKIGKSISTATSDSLLFIFALMIFESQFGSLSTALQEVPVFISMLAPIIFITLGIKIMLKLISK